VNNLFTDLNGDYVFSYLDGLMMSSASISEHQGHLRVVLDRLRSVGLTLHKENVVLGANEIKCLWHLSSRGIRVIPDSVQAVTKFPRP
jgi:hypothetical protein